MQVPPCQDFGILRAVINHYWIDFKGEHINLGNDIANAFRRCGSGCQSIQQTHDLHPGLVLFCSQVVFP